MNDYLDKLKHIFRSPRVLVILGLLGILMIFLSSCFEGGEKGAEALKGSNAELEEYREGLEQEVKRLVVSITGDKKATVVLTLEGGARYSYVDSVSTDSSASTDNGGEHSSQKQTSSFVTVKTADGGEQALLITEGCPKVRGVAIVCSGGADEQTAEKIENAVMAALDITSKRVYIAGGNYNEKG